MVVITHDEDVAAHASRGSVRIVDGQPHRGDGDEARPRSSGYVAIGAPRAGTAARAGAQSAAAPEPRMELRDLFAEAAAGLMARPARVGLTVLGTVIGVAALVATLGLSKTAGNQIVGRFDAIAATDVVITPVGRQRSAASGGHPLGRGGEASSG